MGCGSGRKPAWPARSPPRPCRLRARADDNLASTFSFAPWNDTVVVGNDSGVFRVAPADPAAAASAHLEWVPGTNRSSYGMAAVPGGVLFGQEGAVMSLDAVGRVAPAGEGLPMSESTIASRVRPGRVYVVDQGGQVSGLRRDAATGRWVRDWFRV